MGDLIFFIYVFAGEGEESAQGDSRCAPANMEKKGLHFISLDVTSLQLFACHVICAL